MTIEMDPAGFRVASLCGCQTATERMHVVRDRDTGATRIDWIRGKDTVHDMKCCLRCAMPLRVEAVA